MEAPKTLRRPSNWQDFETLCKKLWGEIWICPTEIQKNGRNGQNQHGVDIFGIPINEEEYFGIQCKGKDEYTEAQFTESEILQEVEKAKGFEPALKKFYLMTTAVNDAKIQTFVRKLNVEHRTKGLFEVHLFAWESIVELIDDNKIIMKWYLMQQGYKINQSISVNFSDGLNEISFKPKFKYLTTYYQDRYRFANPIMPGDDSFFNVRETINLSYIPIDIVINNTGGDPIENHKIILNFEGDVEDLAYTNKKGRDFLLGKRTYVPDIVLNAEKKVANLNPNSQMFVGGDTYRFDTIYLKTKPVQCEIVVNWKLISKDYTTEGKLIIKADPTIERVSRTISVEGSSQLKPSHSEFIDYIVNKEDE